MSKSAGIDVEILQNCSETEFDRLLTAQTSLPNAPSEPQEDLRTVVAQQQ